MGQKASSVSCASACDLDMKEREEDLQKGTNDFDEEEITDEDLENLEKDLDMLVEDLTNTSSDDNATGFAGLTSAQNKDYLEYGSSFSLGDHQKGIKSSKSDGTRASCFGQ
ncbi:hypothetical protein KP509_38G021900 [Ceratopteris richardii]|uniref:Uncharacterized protein n=1 Tax=Ceratopteris richardii TaxID=49495 RepID=A0A8T2Q2E6_CERRI|nr:hypothetical protein KP509_38G021900 [Ceratopteris richardii]